MINYIRLLIIRHGLLVFYKRSNKGWVVFSFSITSYINRGHPSNQELLCVLDAVRRKNMNMIVFDHRRSRIPIWLRLLTVSHIVGMGRFFEGAVKEYKKSAHSILYSTGMYPNYVNNESNSFLQKVGGSDERDLGKFFRLSAPYSDDFLYEVDDIICIGNDITKSSFPLYAHNKIQTIFPIISNPLPVSKYRISEDFNSDNINSMLLLLSKGSLHKGLHQALYICKRDNLKLTIAGICSSELDFVKDSCKRLKIKANLLGFMDFKNSSTWSIFSDHDFSFFCSLSEGMSTTALALVDFGMPIVCNDRIGIDGLVPSFEGFPIDRDIPSLSSFNFNINRNIDTGTMKGMGKSNFINTFANVLSSK